MARIRSLLTAISPGIVCLLLCTTPGIFGDEIDAEEPALTCLEYSESGRMDEALLACRSEYEANSRSVGLARALAQAEFAAGDSEKAVELWRTVIARSSISAADTRNLAMALWRSGRPDEAETLFAEIIDENPGEQAYRDLLGLYLAFDRPDDAVTLGCSAAEEYPDSCGIFEDVGVALAALEQDQEAAASIEKALTRGCLPFRWTTRGNLGGRLHKSAYAGLLAPARVVSGLEKLDDAACRERLFLLKHTMSIEAAPAVTRVVVDRRTSEVRLAGLGLMAQLGASAMPYWKQLLEGDDFILEKNALRRIRELQDPAFTPLLEQSLKRKQTPGNRALTQLTLGEYLLGGEDDSRGEELLLLVSEESTVHGVALLALATHVEKEDPARALELIEQALAVTPNLYVEPDRMKTLREKMQRD